MSKPFSMAGPQIIFQTERNREGERKREREREKQTPYANTYIWNLGGKNGSEKPRGRTGIKTQTWRMDLRTRGGGRVSWDEVREEGAG